IGDVVAGQGGGLVEHFVRSGHPLIQTLAASRVTVVATSASAPSTSPVIPPSLRTACRCRRCAAASPATTAAGSVQRHAAAAASAASVTPAATAGLTVPATREPRPSG